MIKGEPWHVGKDIAVALGYKDVKHSILDHVDLEDRINSKTQGQNVPELGQRGRWLINESGFYSLCLSSKLPSAKQFKRWVTSEVLPLIRKYRVYVDDVMFVSSFGIMSRGLWRLMCAGRWRSEIRLRQFQS